MRKGINMDKSIIFNEYKLLHSEIMYNHTVQNTLSTFTIASVVTILGFAISNHYMLSLLPFVVIIPMMIRIFYCRRATSKISAYMIVFLEQKMPELNWETKNRLFMNKRSQSTILIHLATLRNYEFPLLSAASTMIFIWRFLYDIQCFRFIHIFILLIPLPLITFIFIVSKKINELNSDRNYWVNEWTNFKIKSN